MSGAIPLSNVGFEVIRIRGSHHILRYEDGRSTIVASVFCEHIEEPLGPRRRGDLPGEDFLCVHGSAIVRGIRVVSCANHCSFERDAGKQTLAPAVGVDCGYWRDRSLRVPTYGPSGHANVTSQRYVRVSEEGFHGGIRVEDHHEFRHLSTNLGAEARSTSPL
jgi:hypothetical protein